MSTVRVTSLATGRSELFESGALPQSLSAAAVDDASSIQLNQPANSTIHGKQVTALFGAPKSAGDSASLSTTATDALNKAVSNQPTAGVALDKPLPKPVEAAGGKINLLA